MKGGLNKVVTVQISVALSLLLHSQAQSLTPGYIPALGRNPILHVLCPWAVISGHILGPRHNSIHVAMCLQCSRVGTIILSIATARWKCIGGVEGFRCSASCMSMSMFALQEFWRLHCMKIEGWSNLPWRLCKVLALLQFHALWVHSH